MSSIVDCVLLSRTTGPRRPASSLQYEQFAAAGRPMEVEGTARPSHTARAHSAAPNANAATRCMIEISQHGEDSSFGPVRVAAISHGAQTVPRGCAATAAASPALLARAGSRWNDSCTVICVTNVSLEARRHIGECGTATATRGLFTIACWRRSSSLSCGRSTMSTPRSQQDTGWEARRHRKRARAVWPAMAPTGGAAAALLQRTAMPCHAFMPSPTARRKPILGRSEANVRGGAQRERSHAGELQCWREQDQDLGDTRNG